MNLQIERWIKDYVSLYRDYKETETEWREPVVGFAQAGDPMFLELKKLVGPSHALPQDLLSDGVSIVAFFLPFSKDIIKSNIGDIESSRAWDIANIETNNLILDINKYLHDKFKAFGYTSTIMPATYNYDEKLLASDWSHRHVGYIAGLGTFGINGLLITDEGCCGRMGSLVTTMPLEASEKKTTDKCLFKYNESCGKCINNCVGDAIEIYEGKVRVDRRACNDQIYNDCVPEYAIGIGDACGKCMCGVPCSFLDPVKGMIDKLKSGE